MSLAQCVNAKIGSINTPGGRRPVFILDLADEQGEVAVKFFSVKQTPAGNYAVNRNGDFAKLYRLTIGEHPAARFSRSDKLLPHFIGHWFYIESEQANSDRAGDYNRVIAIKPVEPIVTDGWTITGHLIKKVRTKPVNFQAKNGQRLGNFQAKNGQFLGNCNSASGHTEQGVEAGFNPIPHSLSNIRTSYIQPNISTKYIKHKRDLTNHPPDPGKRSFEIDQIILH